VTAFTVAASAGVATAASRACSSTWLRDGTRLSKTRSAPRRQGTFTAAAKAVAGAASTRRSEGHRQGAARRRAARRHGCWQLVDGTHRGSFPWLSHRPRRRRRPNPGNKHCRRRHEWDGRRVASSSQKAHRKEYGGGSASCGTAPAVPHPLPAHRGQSHPAVVPKCCHHDCETSASAPSSVMADEEMRYTTAVGPLPVLTDPTTWAPAWEREQAHPDE